jgi:hypothetical protein
VRKRLDHLSWNFIWTGLIFGLITCGGRRKFCWINRLTRRAAGLSIRWLRVRAPSRSLKLSVPVGPSVPIQSALVAIKLLH